MGNTSSMCLVEIVHTNTLREGALPYICIIICSMRGGFEVVEYVGGIYGYLVPLAF